MLGLLQYRAWLLSEAYYERMFPIVTNLLQKGTLDRFIKKETLEDVAHRIDALTAMGAESEEVKFSYSTDQQSGLRTARVGNKNIAVISILGPLTKNGDLCSLGMQHYQTMINRANASAAVDGILLIMDTPGGTVDGTPELALTVKNSTKPVGVFADGLVASAGLWIATQAKVIVANKNNYTSIGSIGVMFVMEDWTNMMEAGHIPKMQMVRATKSTQKALLNPIEPAPKEAMDEAIARLDTIANDFISTVKSGRGDKLNTKLEGLFTGKIFDATIAKQNGLIDSVGTLQTALTKVAELSREQQKQQNQNTQGTNQNANMSFPKLSALFSGEAWTKALSAFTEDEAPLEAAEQKVATMEANLTKATEEKAALETRATSAEAKVTELTTQVNTLSEEKKTLEAKVAEQKTALDKKLTGQATTVIPSSKEESQVNEDGSPKNENKFRTASDEKADAFIKAAYPTKTK